MGKEQRTRNKEHGAMRPLSLRIFGYVLMSIFIVSCFSSLAPHAFAYPFLRDLSLGVRGEDVRQLQIVLNSNPQTQVSYSGSGAPGSETDYFGPKTHAAVVRYQNLHASKILTPLGLTTGTGYVGASTRAMLGATSAALQLAVGFTSPVQTPSISLVSPQSGGVGTIITIKGGGFLPTGNKVSTVFEEFNNLPSYDGATLVFTINGPFPKEFLDMNRAFYEEHQAEMYYDFVVSNSNGASASAPFRFTFY